MIEAISMTQRRDSILDLVVLEVHEFCWWCGRSPTSKCSASLILVKHWSVQRERHGIEKGFVSTVIRCLKC